MTRDVLITINGMQNASGDSGSVELITAGDYYWKNGSHYILYEEVDEDTAGIIKNTLKIRPDSLDIIKRGNTNAHMTFEKDKKTISSYMTPFGEMMVGIRTDRILVDEAEDSLKVSVAYSLDINYQHVSDCSIELDVHSRSTAAIHLQQ